MGFLANSFARLWSHNCKVIRTSQVRTLRDQLHQPVQWSTSRTMINSKLLLLESEWIACATSRNASRAFVVHTGLCIGWKVRVFSVRFVFSVKPMKTYDISWVWSTMSFSCGSRTKVKLVKYFNRENAVFVYESEHIHGVAAQNNPWCFVHLSSQYCVVGKWSSAWNTKRRSEHCWF